MGIEAFSILRLERKRALHYVFAAFAFLMGVFTVVFGFSLVAQNLETTSILGWAYELLSIAVMPFFLHGIALLTTRGAIARRRAWAPLIYAPAAVLLARGAFGPILFDGYLLDEKGIWIAVLRPTSWATILYWCYALGCFAIGLGLLFTWWFRAQDSAEKRLSRGLNLATAAALAGFCVSMFSNLSFFYIDSRVTDFLVNLVFSLGFLVWITAFRRAIVGMTGGVADAASLGHAAGRARREGVRRELVSMFSQPVFLLDRDGRIEHCNQAAASAFGRSPADLKDLPLAELLGGGEGVSRALALARPESSLEALDAGGRPLALTFRSIVGETGLTVGYLCRCAQDEAAAREGRAESSSAPLPEAPRLPYGEELSAREYEVLFLLAEGLDVDGIAERLFIAPSTVKSHIHHLYQKTGASNRVGLIKLVGAG